MAETSLMYGLFLKSLANKEVDLDSDQLKVMLCTSAYVPNQDTHQYKSQVTNEITGTNYTAGGLVLSGVTVAYNAANNTLTLDCNDPQWTNATLTARYAVFYDNTPATDATRPLICYTDFGADKSASAGPFTLTIAATGLAFITAAA